MEYRSFDVILLYCQARSAFFEGDLEAYQLLVQQADKFIDEIEDLDTEFCKKYGECSLFIADLSILCGERILINTLPDLNNPTKLVKEYKRARKLLLRGTGRSSVFQKTTPYLPGEGNLVDFYGPKVFEETTDLYQAIASYSVVSGTTSKYIRDLYMFSWRYYNEKQYDATLAKYIITAQKNHPDQTKWLQNWMPEELRHSVEKALREPTAKEWLNM